MRYSFLVSLTLTLTLAFGCGLLGSGPLAYAQSDVGSDGYDSSLDGVDTSSSEPAMQEVDSETAPGAASGPNSSPVPDPDPEAGAGLKTASSRTLLQGKTEKLDIILEDNKLYQVAMKAIARKDYADGIRYLQMMEAQLDKAGHEPYLAQCMFYEAGCHKGLKRMQAAMDTYHKAFELYEKYDASNPLKGSAWKEYETLRAMKGRMDSNPLQGNVNSSALQAQIEQRNMLLELQKAQFAINPNVTLHAKANTAEALLRCNDAEILPKIVKECFSQMSCLETAEIGSNATNAVHRWMPLRVSGATAAFAVTDTAKPAFRATVNGRSYLFDINLPGLGPGIRKILVVTNLQKICAVDVDTYDTWLLRMKRVPDGRVVGARWFKLEHKKQFADKTRSPIDMDKIKLKPLMNEW